MIYKIWAPVDSIWSQWAKPIAFLAARDKKIEINLNDTYQFDNDGRTMLIIDMSGIESILEGLKYAKLGFRPVPLFNSAPVPSANIGTFIDVHGIGAYLYAGTKILNEANLRNDAPPVFLLDIDRYWSAAKTPGTFDNRWRVVPADMPSANYLKEHGILKLVVVSTSIQADLVHILLRYQEAGIGIFIKNMQSGEINPATLSKPPYYKSIFHRLQTFWGLLRHTAGGFGELIPSESTGGYHGG